MNKCQLFDNYQAKISMDSKILGLQVLDKNLTNQYMNGEKLVRHFPLAFANLGVTKNR